MPRLSHMIMKGVLTILFSQLPAKVPLGKRKKMIFNGIKSINSKQDSVIQKITHIESSIEVTTAAVNSLSDTVNRQVVPRIKDNLEEAVDVVHRVGKQRSDGELHHIIIRFVTRRHHDIIWMEAKSYIYLRENGLHIKEFLSKADIESGSKGREEVRFQRPLCCY
ncbi:hypothetical protein M9458_050886 [Cirrhinus mrigala]|uniref:Uncharacterized protein n=1 Tax=Cirrhinus mrigala TaxID=683832 RepID=A0ABD0MUT2_CIRMR